MRGFIGCVALGAAIVTLSALPVVSKDKAMANMSSFLGHWQLGSEQEIGITEAEGHLRIEGFASWGATDPDRVANGAVHFGEFTVQVPPSWIRDDSLAFAVDPEGQAIRPEDADQYDCVIRLTAANNRLEAEDNMMCGGLNVTFNGTYKRGD